MNNVLVREDPQVRAQKFYDRARQVLEGISAEVRPFYNEPIEVRDQTFSTDYGRNLMITLGRVVPRKRFLGIGSKEKLEPLAEVDAFNKRMLYSHWKNDQGGSAEGTYVHVYDPKVLQAVEAGMSKLGSETGTVIEIRKVGF